MQIAHTELSPDTRRTRTLNATTLDTVRFIDTPEGVHLAVSPAGPVVRTLAFAVDALIRAAVLFVLSLLIGWLGEFGVGLWLLAGFLLEWLYPVAFEMFRNGATPGKKMYRLRVVHENGTPVGWTGSLVRNLLRAVDFLPVAYCFGLVTMLIDGKFRRLGDLAAGTLVIHASSAATRAPETTGATDASPLPLPWTLTLDEQTALVAFADRASTLTPERAEEIASVLRPLGVSDVATIQRHAAWIRGQR